MRLPTAEHTRRPWRIHEFTSDFTVEDVWALRAPGASTDDFVRFREAIAETGDPRNAPLPVRFLLATRRALGVLLRLDGPESGLAVRVSSVRARLPQDVAATISDSSSSGPFSPLYELPDEGAEESANRTVHVVAHFGWVAEPDGGRRVQLAVLVRPNGRLGRLYLHLIAPIRRAIVYPLMTRRWERLWHDTMFLGRA